MIDVKIADKPDTDAEERPIGSYNIDDFFANLDRRLAEDKDLAKTSPEMADILSTFR